MKPFYGYGSPNLKTHLTAGPALSSRVHAYCHNVPRSRSLTLAYPGLKCQPLPSGERAQRTPRKNIAHRLSDIIPPKITPERGNGILAQRKVFEPLAKTP